MNFFNYYSPADEGGLIWTPTEATVVELTPVPMPTKVSNAWPKGVVPLNDGGLLLKAGTPLYLKSGVWFPSNSSTSGKRIIVAEDYAYHPSDPIQNCLVSCITKGFVDQAKAEAAYGYSYASADKSGFDTAGIVLAGADFGSGGGVPDFTGNASSYIFLGVNSSKEPAWGNLASVVAMWVDANITLTISEEEDTSDGAQEGDTIWYGDQIPSSDTLAIRAIPLQEDGADAYFYFQVSCVLDEVSQNWVYTFKAPGSTAYFTYDYATYSWAYHSGT